MATHILRVVHKDNYDQQHFFDIDQSILPALGNASVRVKSRILGLSAANPAYCEIGRMRGDWECFQLPPSLPKPFNDDEHYGIAPTWGYAEILSSNISHLKPGTILWGYVPTSACPVDLELEQSKDEPANWEEVSKRRTKMLPIYNRYIVIDQPSYLTDETILKFSSCMWPTWESGYLLGRFCFATPPLKPIHPSGNDGDSWTSLESDLKSTLVILLAAGSRTSRAFMHQLVVSRDRGQGPVGCIGVTESEQNTFDGPPQFPIKFLSYADAEDSGLKDWMSRLDFQRILIVDFGGRNNILASLMPSLREEWPLKKVDIICVGADMKGRSGEDFAARIRTGLQMNGLMFNTGAVNGAAMVQIGEKKYYEETAADFAKLIQSELERTKGNVAGAKVLGMQLNEKYGMRGENSLERAWKELCEGNIRGSIAIAVDLRIQIHPKTSQI